MGEARENKYTVPAVVAAARLLDLLATPEFAEGARQSDLAGRAEISRSSAHNLLVTLEDLRYVERESGTKLYRLGPALIGLGRSAARGSQIGEAVTAEVADLALAYPYTFAAAQVIGGREAVVVDCSYPPAGMHVGITPGDSYGPLQGAIGKVLLAAMDPDEAESVVAEGELRPLTPATLTSPAKLLADVRRVRERGWASSIKEFNENHAVAVGVSGLDGRLEMVILALAFPAQLPQKEVADLGAEMRRRSEAITAACGGEPVEGSPATLETEKNKKPSGANRRKAA